MDFRTTPVPEIRREPEGSLSSWPGWLGKGIVAVLDQGILSAANFVLYILLARWLTANDYGMFALSFSIYMFLFAIHYALLQEPVSVLGHSPHLLEPSRYFSALIVVHLLVTCATALPTLLAAGLLHALPGGAENQGLSQTLGTLAVFSPFMLCVWLSRRTAYLAQRPRLALATSAIYSSTLGGALFLMKTWAWTSPAAAFAAMGIASVSASIWLLRKFSPNPRLSDYTREIFRQHWGFGRWLLALGLVAWVSKDAYFFLSAALIGTEQTGAFRAIANLLNPLDQVLTALGVLLLPWLSARCSSGESPRIKGPALYITLAATAITLAYLAVISLLASPLLGLLYRGKYSDFAWMLPGLTLVQLFRAISMGSFLGLLATQNSRAVFRSGFAGAVITLTVGLGLMRWWGLKGLVGSLLLSAVVPAGLLIYFFHNSTNSSNNREHHTPTGHQHRP